MPEKRRRTAPPQQLQPGGAALCGLLVAKHDPALMNLAGMLTLLALAITYALSCGLLTAWLALPAPEKK